MLILQIALGIVLAVVILNFWRELSVLAIGAIGAIGVVGVVAIVILGGSFAYNKLKPAPEPTTTSESGYYPPDPPLTPQDVNKMKVVDLGVIQDKSTGLIWPVNGNMADKQMNWYDANIFTKNLNYGGFTDWRLPSKEELEYFMKRLPSEDMLDSFKKSRVNPPTESNGFKNIQYGMYWTSNTPEAYPLNAGYVNVVIRSVNYTQKTNKNGYVWPVRSGNR